MDSNIFLSVIIPSYNEESRLPNTLKNAIQFLSQKSFQSEIIVVDDGSSDQTFQTASTFLSSQSSQNQLISYQLIKNPKNLGKGQSIRSGVDKARGLLILFMDADNSTPIEELDKFIPLIKPQGKNDIVIGSRHLKESSILVHQPWHRKLLGRSANFLIQLLLLPGITDTQCGFKLFNGNIAKDLFAKTFLPRWGFDMEILFLARKMGYQVLAVPVTWLNSSASRLRPIKDGLNTLKELLEIKLNNWQGRYS